MDKLNAVGRRKAAVARVYIDKGKGNITVNGKDFKEYFCVPFMQDQVLMPLQALEMTGDFDIRVNVKGGGIKGQAEATRCLLPVPS